MPSGPLSKVTDLLDEDFSSLRDGPILDRIDAGVLAEFRVPLPGLGSTDQVDRVEHEIPGNTPIRVRTHRAKASSGDLPCVLSIHGGGYVLGSYNMDDVRFESWCTRLGVMGVSVDYRLAPEVPYPGPLDDCYDALVWTVENAGSLGADPARIGVYGASAGGGLAAALALLARDRGTPALSFQLLESPMLDDRQNTQSSQLSGLPIWGNQANEFGWRSYLGKAYGDEEVPAYAAPSRALDLSGLPKAFVSVGSVDGFRDEDIDYAIRLNQAGVPTELHVYPGAPHGYQMFADSRIARQSERDSDSWLKHVAQ
jgi:acetyl esterase/lipase